MDEQANPYEATTPFVMHHTGTPQKLGSLRGKIWIAPDFDEPDDELIDLMENGPIFPDEADRLRG